MPAVGINVTSLNQKPLPRRLKKADSGDYLPIENNNGDILLVTKQETILVIREFIRAEIGNLREDDTLILERKRIENILVDKIHRLEKELEAYVNYKFDTIAEQLCEKLLTRKFNEEVQKRVDEKLEKIRQKKLGKGFS